MVTEDFCFPTIANNLAHLNMSSNPSLWRIPSQSEKNAAGARHKWRRKSFSELEGGKSRPRQDEVGGGVEEKMDMLWEDFNEELHGDRESGSESSGSDSQRPPASISCSKRVDEHGAVRICKTSGGGGGGGPFSPFLVVKMLKKLLMLQNSATLKRHASLP